MIIETYKNFRKSDRKKYELLNNEHFLETFYNMKDQGYEELLSVHELQSLIDFLVNWYEIKYPEDEFLFYDGIKKESYPPRLSKNMNFEQLYIRVPDKVKILLTNQYRSNVHEDIYVKNGDGLFEEKIGSLAVTLTFPGSDGKSIVDYQVIHVDSITGKIYTDTYGLLGVNIPFGKKIDYMLDVKEPHVDYSEVEHMVNNHNLDAIIREFILKLSFIKMVYSNNTTAAHGYKRAVRFINEFNDKLGLLIEYPNMPELLIIEDKGISKNKKYLKKI